MITLKRKDQWLSAYHDELELIRRTPFSWKEHECASGLAARVVLAVTGVDLALPYAGRYDDAVSAYRTLRSTGFADLADFAASVLPEYDHPVDAHIADIAAIPIHTPFRHVLGVFNGERIWVLTEAGLGSVDRTSAVRAFKVG